MFIAEMLLKWFDKYYNIKNLTNTQLLDCTDNQSIYVEINKFFESKKTQHRLLLQLLESQLVSPLTIGPHSISVTRISSSDCN
jgi:hypothetical protein